MGAVHMLKIFYFVYKPTGKLLPVMPHCDNDFETMALKHSIAFDKMAEKSQATGRRLADFDHKCGCPYLPGFVDGRVVDVHAQEFGQLPEDAVPFHRGAHRRR